VFEGTSMLYNAETVTGAIKQYNPRATFYVKI